MVRMPQREVTAFPTRFLEMMMVQGGAIVVTGVRDDYRLGPSSPYQRVWRVVCSLLMWSMITASEGGEVFALFDKVQHRCISVEGYLHQRAGDLYILFVTVRHHCVKACRELYCTL